MTFLEFVCMRKRELARFCRARFGRRWRQTVTHQLGIHPRTFERWARGAAVPRHLGRVESWARSIGFTSPADAEIAAALREHDRFQRLAKRQTARAKGKAERKSPEPTSSQLEAASLHAAILESLNNPNPIPPAAL